jgi:di/tricarboxylate transporter
MTTPQILSIAIFALVMVLMVWGKLRYDLVAGIGLMAGVAVGIVPVEGVFKGFSDDILIIVGSALIISAGIARSGILLSLLRYVTPWLTSTQAQVIFLVTTVGVLSAIIKNIGALAMLLPIAFQFARKTGQSASVFLMPMAFASLLGGIVTLVGTSPNVIVARVRGELTGTPFSMFDFTPVGIWIAIAGMIFLFFGYRLMPRDRRSATALSDALESKHYVTEARLAETSPMIGKTISDVMSRAEAGVTLISLITAKARPVALFPDVRLNEGDIMILRGEQSALDHLIKEAGLSIEGDDRPTDTEDPQDKSISIEVVIEPNSVLIGSGARLANLYQRYGINLLAVGRSGEKIDKRLRDIQLAMGDTLVIRGAESVLSAQLPSLGLLPLAERTITLGEVRRGWIALTILAVTIVVLAFNLLPVALTLFAAAGLMILSGALPVREAYDKIECRSCSCLQP